MTDNTILMAGKLEKCLDKLHDFSNFSNDVRSFGVLSLRAFLALNIPVYKKTFTQTYSSKKICLEYKELINPKIKYYVYFTGNLVLEIPKLVWNSLNIPIKE